MITVAKATSAEYYTSGAGVAAGMESYYLDAVTAGEPPGQWLGAGAAALGLHGIVDAQEMHVLYGDFVDPRTGEQLGNRPANRKTLEEKLAAALEAEPGALPERVAEIRRTLERTDRKNVIGWDATFNVAKSVTVVHTAMHRAELAALRDGDRTRAAEYARVRLGIEAAITTANEAGMRTLEKLATVRTGGGSGAPLQWESADGVVIASFQQHTNRSIEPHVHVHNVTLNRARGADGTYRALDGRDLLAQRYWFSAVADRVLAEQLAELGLPMQTRADGMGREVALVPAEVIDHFSTRRRQVTAAVAPLVETAQDTLGRELTDVELYRLSRQATLSTRAAKTHDGESRQEMVDRWYADLVASTGRTLDSIADLALATIAAGPVPAEAWSPSAVLNEAVAACSARSATWGKANLISEIELRLPTLGLGPDQVAPLLESLADQALTGPDVVQVAAVDAGPYAAPSARRYATTGTLAAEAALRRAAVTRGGLSLDRAEVAAWLDAHAPAMGADQRAAVEGLAASPAALAVLVGPAGTGKSYAAGALAHAWSDLGGGTVVGLAVSQIATTVLRDDGVENAANISAWLAAHRRLADGTATADDARWRLRASDLVLVDESSMVATEELTAVRELVQAAGARMVLTGDPRQLAAVDGGGVLGLLDGHAETYYLSEVRRFVAPWERQASLALRDGDRQALVTYERHGRFVEVEGLDAAIASAARAAVADRVDGRSVVVIASSNAQAAHLSGQIRDRLVDLGLVAADGVYLERDGGTAGVGDLVACRRNDYALGVINRAQYRVIEVGDDGSLLVEPLAAPDPGSRSTPGPVRLPAEYVAADVQLGYASTVHAAQGLTVDASHLVTDGGLDAAALYVGLSRGRIRNTAHVAVAPEPAELPAVDGARGGQTRLGADAPRASALAVLDSALDRDDPAPAATVAAEQDAAVRASAATIAGHRETEVRLVCRARLENHLDDLVADGTLTPDVRARLATDQASEHLSRLLRAVEHTGADPRRALREALADDQPGRQPLADAQSVAQVLSYRITRGQELPLPQLTDDVAPPADVPPAHATRIRDLGTALAARRAELGARTAQEAPPWAVLTLGPVPAPTNTVDRADWERRAGIAAAHREATGWTDPDRALGPAPGLSTTERRADHATAWAALGRPADRLDESALSDGQLRVRVRAWDREQAWAPAHADQALRAAEHAAERARQDAALAEAEGRPHDAEPLRRTADLKAAAARTFADLADARARWATRTAVTRAKAEAARAELDARGIAVGTESDRTTATRYLNPDHLDPATAPAAADDDRPVTEADVRDVDPADDTWAARLDDHSPDVALAPTPPVVTDPDAAHQVAPTAPTGAELDLLLAQASLAVSVAADQASRDDAWQAEDIRRREEAADAAGRARRDAAETDPALTSSTAIEAADNDDAAGD